MGNDYDLSDMIRDVRSSANFWERCLWPCLSMCFNVFQCVSASVNPVLSSSTIMFHELRVHQPTLCVLMLLC